MMDEDEMPVYRSLAGMGDDSMGGGGAPAPGLTRQKACMDLFGESPAEFDDMFA